MYVCADLASLSHARVIEVIESKLISVCLINDYSLIADLHIFAYGRDKFSSISLECTKVKLLILNNFVLPPSISITLLPFPDNYNLQTH